MVIKAPLSLLSSRLNELSSLPFFKCQASRTFGYPRDFSLDPFHPVHGFVGFLHIRDQSWTQRTSIAGVAWQVLSEISWVIFSLLVMPLLMQSIVSVILLAFFAITAHCSLTGSCSFTRTPRSLSTELLLRQVHPSLCCTPGFFQAQDRALVLVELLKVLCTSCQCLFSSVCVFFCFSVSGTLLFWLWADSEVHS